MTLPVINAIWIGDTMGPIHAACLKSFVVTGHEVVLHSYGEVSDAPEGIRYADASRLRRREALVRDRGGSYAPSSDLMRYEILRQGLGLYVDADVFCLRPMDDAEMFLGREDQEYLNGAVLKLPADSPMLADLCAIDDDWRPPWRMPRPGSKPPQGLADFGWGTIGPQAVTYYARKHGLEPLAAARQVFYPVHYTQIGALVDPHASLDSYISGETRYVHLYNDALSKVLPGHIPTGSPLARLLAMVE